MGVRERVRVGLPVPCRGQRQGRRDVDGVRAAAANGRADAGADAKADARSNAKADGRADAEADGRADAGADDEGADEGADTLYMRLWSFVSHSITRCTFGHPRVPGFILLQREIFEPCPR